MLKDNQAKDLHSGFEYIETLCVSEEQVLESFDISADRVAFMPAKSMIISAQAYAAIMTGVYFLDSVWADEKSFSDGRESEARSSYFQPERRYCCISDLNFNMFA